VGRPVPPCEEIRPASTMRIVIMVAMEEEAQYLRPLLTGVHNIDMPGVHGDKASRGYAGEAVVDIVVSGIGAVWASSATTAALLAITPAGGKVDAVISCGCSGAHAYGQKMGDMVIGSSVMPLDPQVIASDGSLTYPGVRFSMTTKGTTHFMADPHLLELATAAAHEIKAARVPGMRIDVGVVGSGDAWRQSVKVIREVHERTHSLCEEMEAHAVAQVAARFGVPFIAIKDIANSELEPEAIQLEPSHHIVPDTCKVGYHAALVTDATVRKLAGLPPRTDASAPRLDLGSTVASPTASPAPSPVASRKRAVAASSSVANEGRAARPRRTASA